MSEIIYLKDVFLAKMAERQKSIKKALGSRTKTKSPTRSKLLKSFLIEKDKKGAERGKSATKVDR
ncbi:MAG: hypothetical protein IJA14_01380 [Alphaproteobacteria bacterium]|nr:hypothetical protein [Alphaproteobacteria bacterium]